MHNEHPRRRRQSPACPAKSSWRPVRHCGRDHDEAHYYPLHVAPYTPEKRLAKGRQDPAFRTKPQIALELVERAQAAGIAFCAIVADCFYGDNHALETALLQRRLPNVLARCGAVGRGWAPA